MLCALTACNGNNSVSSGRIDVDSSVVTVDFSTRRQTMETAGAIGGNYTKNRMYASRITVKGERKDDDVGIYNLSTLNPGVVRVGIPLDYFKPYQNVAGSDATFNNSDFVKYNFDLMKDFTDDGRMIIASVWDVPDWMVSNPDNVDQRLIKSDMWDAFASAIAEFVEYGITRYGIKFSFLSVNEPNGGNQIRLSAAEYTDLIKRTSAKLRANGYTIPWLAGDTDNAYGLLQNNYARNQLDDPECRQDIGAISYHSWEWNPKALDPANLEQIYQLGKTYGLPVWVCEQGYDPSMSADMHKSWEGALKLGVNYYRALKYTGASMLLYWTYQWDFELVDPYDVTSHYPIYYIVKQLNDTLLPGMIVVGAESTNPNICPIVSFNNNQVTVNLWNSDASETIPVVLKNLPDGEYEIISSCEAINWSASDRVTVSGNTAKIEMPPRSMMTLVYRTTGSEIEDFTGN